MSRKLALVIGNSEYADSKLARLVTPGTDVKALAGVLQAPEIGGFDEVTLLVDQPESVVRRAIARFFAEKRRDDLLVLYFSGHGVLDDHGQLYLAVKDTEPTLLSATAIQAGLITHEMDRSHSRRQVLILDCCHSGAFARGAKGVAGATVGTAAAFEGSGYGRVVLTATDATQYAWEGEEVIGQAENSVFTHHLVQGLQTGEADADADGQITLDELYNYVYERMLNTPSKQTPGKWSYKQQGEIVLAKNARPVVKPVALQPELQRTIESSLAWEREGAVRELDRLLHGSDPGLGLTARAALERLKDDDSRRVSAAATESLARYTEPQHPREEQSDVVGKAEVVPSESIPDEVSSKSPTRDYVVRGGGERPGSRVFGTIVSVLGVGAIGTIIGIMIGAAMNDEEAMIIGGIFGGVCGAAIGLAIKVSRGTIRASISDLTIGAAGNPAKGIWRSVLLSAIGWVAGGFAAFAMGFGWLIGSVIGGTGAAMLWRFRLARRKT